MLGRVVETAGLHAGNTETREPKTLSVALNLVGNFQVVWFPGKRPRTLNCIIHTGSKQAAFRQQSSFPLRFSASAPSFHGGACEAKIKHGADPDARANMCC